MGTRKIVLLYQRAIMPLNYKEEFKMKSKRLLAFLLTICMIGGMLPTVFAAEGEATTTTLEYDFRCTALLEPDGTPHGTDTVKYSDVNNYTVNEEKSNYWKFERLINVDNAPFQDNGLYFKTARAGITPNNNAVVFTINVPASGSYTASVSGYKNYYNNEWTDIYLVSKDVVTAKGWNVATIGGIQAAIAVSSMNDPAASVKHIASYDACYNATGADDELAENVYLFAGDYYMFVVASDSTTDPSPGTEDASNIWGMLTKLTLTSEDAVEAAPVVYSFVAEAVKAGVASQDMRFMKDYTQLDSSISTGAWMYSGFCHRMDGYTMYPDADGGATFRAAKGNLGNNAFILKAKVENSGTYTPSMVYTTYSQYGKLNIYFVPVSYADSKWTMSDTNLNLAEVFGDEGVKLVASQNGWVSSGSTANITGEYGDVYLGSGEYYVLISLFEGNGVSTHVSNAYFKTKGLTLTPQSAVALTASKDTVKVRETATVSVALKNEAGNTAPTSSVTYKSLAPSVATVDNSGVVTGVEEGTATIQVTASSCGVEFTSTIDITVSRDVKYVFTKQATDGTLLELMRYTNIDSAVSAPWRYMCKTNIETGSVTDYGLNFRVNGTYIGNGGYVLKIPVENPGIYTPAVTWDARTNNSIVNTYIVPAAYANARWSMANGTNLADIAADTAGVKLVVSADMSTSDEKKSGNPIKLSDDEYYVIVLISELGNGNDSEGKAFAMLESLELDWVSALSEDVENQYVSLALTDNVNKEITVEGSQYRRGDEVEIEAPEIEGYTFRRWVRGTEEQGELVSTEPSFTYKLITNTYLTAVYTPNVEEDAKIVEFFNGNREYITTVNVVDDKVEAPAAPSLTGFKFLDWFTAKDTKLSETVLTAPVTRAVAVFEDTGDRFTVDGVEDLKYDTKITRTYNDKDSVVWYRDDVRVGFGTTYEYYVWDNVEKITYVEGTAQPLVVLDKAVKTDSTGTNAYMIEYDAGGKTIVEVGILFGGSEGGTVDSCEYKAVSQEKGGTTGHGQFTAKPANSTQTAARGYMIYQDGSEYKVVYSD